MFNKSKLSLLIKAVSVTALSTGLIACGGADNPPLDPTKPVVEYSELRVLNALPGAPTLSIEIGEAKTSTTASTEAEVFWNLNYGNAKPFFAFPAGTGLTVTVKAEMPGVYKLDPATGLPGLWAANPLADTKNANYDKDAPALIIDAVNGERLIESSTAIIYKGEMDFAAGAKKDLVLSGALTVGNILDVLSTASVYSYDLTTNATTPVVADSVPTGITIGNFSSQASIDVYAVADCAAITGTPLVSALLKDTLTNVAVPTPPTAPNVNELCITAAGNTTAIFDAGEFALAEGMWVNAIDNTNGITGESALKVAVQDGALYSVLVDQGDDAEFRVVNAAESNDGTGIDMALGGVNIAAGLAFGSATAATAVTSNADSDDIAYISELNATGDTTVIEAKTGITVRDGQTSTVLAFDGADDIETITLADDRRSVVTEARVRFIHGSLAFDNVNIYVLDQADGVAFDDEDADGDYIASPVSTAETTDDISLSLAPGTYDVAITKAAIAAVQDKDTGEITSPAIPEDRATPIYTGSITVALGDVKEYVVIDATATTAQVVTLP